MGEKYADQHPWPSARSGDATCGAPRRHSVGGPIQARQVLYARQQVHIRLGGILGRAGIGAIQGTE